MKDFYKNWPPEFIEKIDELRYQDEQTLSNPVYVERRAGVYSAVIIWLTAELESRGLFNTALDVPATANACICGDTGSAFCDYRNLAA
ncbi:hypothetical protein LG695_004464, partial [Salmonella enterica]|nr:hypothetical protein [Salmonella enterica]